MLVMELDLGPLLPQHVEEIVAGFLLLALLWFIFAKFVSPMFEKMYQERASQIEGGIRRAQQAELEAAAAKKEYEAQLAGARQDAAKVREEAKLARFGSYWLRATCSDYRANLAQAEKECDTVLAGLEEQSR